MIRPTPPDVHASGFALLAVLWVMVGVAALALAASFAAREAVAGTQNRINLTRAWWRAEDCLERTRAAIADALVGEMAVRPHTAPTNWSSLDGILSRTVSQATSGCDVQLRPAGMSIDVNTVSEERLHRLLRALRVPLERADSLVAALLDWRDSDRIPRASGAERAEYEARGAFPPRDGPLADIRELQRVRGWDAVVGADSLLGVDQGRVSINHAPLLVLRALPGFVDETVARIAEHRLHGLAINDLNSLSLELSPPARDSLIGAYSELFALASTEPDAWILTSRAEAGVPAVRIAIEVRLVRASDRAAVVRRKTWIW